MTDRLKEADERTKRELADKCQENGWLRRGGYPWQDDPYLEEYPYEFAKAGSVEELRGFFAHGNWALRQGINSVAPEARVAKYHPSFSFPRRWQRSRFTRLLQTQVLPPSCRSAGYAVQHVWFCSRTSLDVLPADGWHSHSDVW